MPSHLAQVTLFRAASRLCVTWSHALSLTSHVALQSPVFFCFPRSYRLFLTARSWCSHFLAPCHIIPALSEPVFWGQGSLVGCETAASDLISLGWSFPLFKMVTFQLSTVIQQTDPKLEVYNIHPFIMLTVLGLGDRTWDRKPWGGFWGGGNFAFALAICRDSFGKSPRTGRSSALYLLLCNSSGNPSICCYFYTVVIAKLMGHKKGYVDEKPEMFTNCFTVFFTLMLGAWVGRGHSLCLAERLARTTTHSLGFLPMWPLYCTCDDYMPFPQFDIRQGRLRLS